ncbi:uncharacterized protein LOC106173924 [Lingula anatina]|uniref:Uncharacterized protein LOC106173924 n=1 Tax=Lingula anatina TaxID=7574 RepID=A0A1S3JK14_LINAN|nr:uncharacterized protein LOC106173924 [Lingula anatina]|eukprot:XP_013410717.1 uncharacterized protein LOC106173924 [Lingula anatina]
MAYHGSLQDFGLSHRRFRTNSLRSASKSQRTKAALDIANAQLEFEEAETALRRRYREQELKDEMRMLSLRAQVRRREIEAEIQEDASLSEHNFTIDRYFNSMEEGNVDTIDAHNLTNSDHVSHQHISAQQQHQSEQQRSRMNAHHPHSTQQLQQLGVSYETEPTQPKPMLRTNQPQQFPTAAQSSQPSQLPQPYIVPSHTDPAMTFNTHATEYTPMTAQSIGTSTIEQQRQLTMNDQVAHLLQQQQRALQEITLNQEMPKREYLYFNGDPVSYPTFIRNFETNIEQRVPDFRSKLSYLIQYCTGEAKEAIKSCVILEPEEGYFQARNILQTHFGQKHIIIKAMLEKIVTGPPIKASDVTRISKLSRDMTTCQMTASKMGYYEDLNSMDTLEKVVRRLPQYLQAGWAKRSGKLLNQWIEVKFKDLADYLEEMVHIANTRFGQLVGSKPDVKPKSKVSCHNTSYKTTTLATNVHPAEKSNSNSNKSQPSSVQRDPCVFCSGNHTIKQCFKFARMNYSDRKILVSENKLCFNCLQSNPPHTARTCQWKQLCQVPGCGKRHHALLHPPCVPANSPALQREPGANATSVVTDPVVAVQSAAVATGRRISLQIVPVTVSGGNGGPIIETYAFLDNGSDHSLCLHSLAEKLGASGKPIQYSVSTVNDESCVNQGQEVQLEVKAINSQQGLILDQVWTTDRLPICEKNIPNNSDISEWSHLKDVRLPELDDKTVTILIGNDHPEAHWRIEERRGDKKQPYAIRTILGWTILGPTKRPNDGDVTVNFIHADQVLGCDNSLRGCDSISIQLSKMYNSEFSESSVSSSQCMSLEDKKAKRIMDESVVFVDGHYQVTLPWKSDELLPNNKPAAEKRLNLLKRRLRRDENLREKYTQALQEYIDKGHAQKIDHRNLYNNSNSVWYLPHHPVINSKKSKIRVVFDCAAEYSGVYLNDSLLQGTDLTNSLIGVLLRFRQEKIAIVADIEQMYHQVRVHPDDRDALRFLWWPAGDLSKQPEEYQMPCFGATSSASCTVYALLKNAEDHGKDFDFQTVETDYRNFYVDDCLKSVETVDEAKKMITQFTSLLQKGGFHLTKWISNQEEVLFSVPTAEQAPSVRNVNFDKQPIEHVLGVQWNIEKDTFGYCVRERDVKNTRRGILSFIASIYDPLGFAAPLILKPKQILQELCREGIAWDSDLPAEDLNAWTQWREGLDNLQRIEVPRCYKSARLADIQSIELHHFSDASLSGYGIVSYLRFVDITCCASENSDCSTNGADSSYIVCESSQTNDGGATTAHSSCCFLDRFYDCAPWYHVDSDQNPADYASRGIQLRSDNGDDIQRWLHGPAFLYQPEIHWPKQPDNLHEIPENDREVKRKSAQIHVTTSSEVSDGVERLLHHFSSWYTLQKSVAWILRFKRYLLSRVRQLTGDRNNGPLTVQEITLATDAIVMYVQAKSFPKECNVVSSAMTKKPDSKGYVSPLRKLSPIKIDGILCVGGRLQNAAISTSQKHPKILPHDHHVTEIIVRHYHIKEGHVGAYHVLSVIRQEFWITRGLSTVKKVIRKCMVCRRWNAVPSSQVMAPLPKSRVTPGKPPFYSVGVDYFGPLLVKCGRRTNKRYGCIFTCMATRAVHLEISYNLSSDSFIQAVLRFISRRGPPCEIFSDNGTNFTGAEADLKRILQQWNQEKISDSLLRRNIQWYFNPPNASHAGGVWERLIRSVRKIMRSVLGNRLVDDETLITVLTEVEKIMNDRPLIRKADHYYELETLSPNQLLLLRSNPCLPADNFTERDQYNEQWKHAQLIADQFWQRWIKEYLPVLQERQKWLRPAKNFEKGDFVLLIDENAFRGQWPKGLIEETFPDKYGHVRQVIVKTAKGRFRRDVRKLCLLEGNFV